MKLNHIIEPNLYPSVHVYFHGSNRNQLHKKHDKGKDLNSQIQRTFRAQFL